MQKSPPFEQKGLIYLFYTKVVFELPVFDLLFSFFYVCVNAALCFMKFMSYEVLKIGDKGVFTQKNILFFCVNRGDELLCFYTNVAFENIRFRAIF